MSVFNVSKNSRYCFINAFYRVPEFLHVRNTFEDNVSTSSTGVAVRVHESL